jgi:hypothetical protein
MFRRFRGYEMRKDSMLTYFHNSSADSAVIALAISSHAVRSCMSGQTAYSWLPLLLYVLFVGCGDAAHYSDMHMTLNVG